MHQTSIAFLSTLKVALQEKKKKDLAQYNRKKQWVFQNFIHSKSLIHLWGNNLQTSDCYVLFGKTGRRWLADALLTLAIPFGIWLMSFSSSVFSVPSSSPASPLLQTTGCNTWPVFFFIIPESRTVNCLPGVDKGRRGELTSLSDWHSYSYSHQKPQMDGWWVLVIIIKPS